MRDFSSPLSWIGRMLFPIRLFVGLAVVGLALEWIQPKPLFDPAERVTQMVAIAVVVGGLALRGWAAGCAGGHTRSHQIEAPTLVTGGPFAYVRNPIYLGTVVIGLGMSMLLGDPKAYLFSALTFAVLYLTIIPAEERFLLGEFGAAYRDYCRTVPRLLPRWRNRVSVGAAPFRWRSSIGELRIAGILVLVYAALLFEEHLDALTLK